MCWTCSRFATPSRAGPAGTSGVVDSSASAVSATSALSAAPGSGAVTSAKICATKSAAAFAAETATGEDLLRRAATKRRGKAVDLIAVNEVGWDKGFESTQNRLLIVGGGDEVVAEASGSKRQVADTLNSRLGAIMDGLARFSGPGLNNVNSLVQDSRRSIDRIERAISDLERNPQRIITGGDGTVRQYDGRARR